MEMPLTLRLVMTARRLSGARPVRLEESLEVEESPDGVPDAVVLRCRLLVGERIFAVDRRLDEGGLRRATLPSVAIQDAWDAARTQVLDDMVAAINPTYGQREVP